MEKRTCSMVMCVLCFSVVVLLALAPSASADFQGPYETGNWSSSGISEGTTLISPHVGPATIAVFSYYVDIHPADNGVSYRTTTFSATAAGTGYVSFDWTYTFLHSWFDVYADFYVFADGPSGTTSIHEVDFYNWMYTGPQTFSGSSTIWVEEGYDFGFIIGGSNYDYSGLLLGTLTVSNFVAPPVIIEIDIDIKPGSDPNCFNNDGHGVIPVAILGSADFDVTQVDAGTVTLEGLAVRAVGKSDKLLAHYEDVNYDGYDDLVIQIEDVDGAFLPGIDEATLTGNLLDGTPFEGTDFICIVPAS